MKHIPYIFAFISIMLFGSIEGQCHSHAEQPNNNLLTYNWVMSRDRPFFRANIDSTTTPYSLFLETVRENKGVLGFSIPLFQEGDSQSEVLIEINYKIENGCELYFKLVTIGDCEEIKSTDSLYLPVNEKWTPATLSVDLMEAAFLNLSIEAKGDEKKNAKIWVNGLEVSINGKSIRELKSAEKGIKVPLSKEDIASIDSKSLNSFSFMTRKILALGETIHGTETLNNTAIEIIKDRIIHNNCKLVLLEIPFENSFYINRYILGDPNFKIDSISTYFDRSLLSYSFLPLIEWIKEHNSRLDEKVYFWGVDVSFIQLQSKLELFNFFYTLNETEQNEELKKMCKLLVNTNPSLDEVIAIFDTNKGFEDILSKDESDLMRHCLIYLNNKSDTYTNFINRDEAMYKNTEFLINNLLKLNETVTLFCHFGHVAYQGVIERTLNIESHTLGYYMKNKYEDDYSCIALMAGKGDFLTSDSYSQYFKVKSLQPSTQGSLEYLMDELNENCSYLSTDKLNCNDVLKIRYIGNMYIEDQFSFIMPKARMDGAIFVKQVYPIDIDFNLEQNVNVVIMNSYQAAVVSCMAQIENQDYSDVYGLNFSTNPDSKVIYPWLVNAAYSNYTIPMGIKHSDRTLFAVMYFSPSPFIDRLKSEHQQRILLPSNNHVSANIEFEYKCNNVSLITLTFDAIDRKEKIISSETLTFMPDSTLSSASMCFNIESAEMINVTIYAEGVTNEEAYIAFSKLDILLDGKPIDTFPLRLMPSKLLPNINVSYIPINDKTQLEDIDAISNSKIIALGESIHGNSSITNFVYNAIVKAVDKQNIKLILLEMPIEMSLLYNRYIQEDNFVLDSAMFANPQLEYFLNRLKDYNSINDEHSRVMLLGIDFKNSSIDLFDFISKVNNTHKLSELDQLSILIWDKEWDRAIDYIEKNRTKVESIFHKNEIECLLHIMRISKRSPESGIKRFIDRDSIMYVNTKFMIDKFLTDETSKVIIHAHAAHINPVSTYPAVPCVPFGSYMITEYGNDYFTSLVAIGKGESVALDDQWSRKNRCLMEAPDGSLESFLNSSINEDIAYIPISTDFDRLVLSRFKGSHHIKQEFFPFNLYQRYDGVFFIKEESSDNIKKTEVSFEKMSESKILETKQREAKIKEIRGSIINSLLNAQ